MNAMRIYNTFIHKVTMSSLSTVCARSHFKKIVKYNGGACKVTKLIGLLTRYVYENESSKIPTSHRTAGAGI